MATITGTLTGSLKQGDSLSITTTLLDMSGYDNTDVFYVSSAPADGQLWVAGRQLAATSTFTRAELALGTLTYRHSGTSVSADAIGLMIRNGESDYTYTAESTLNITISATNAGWLYAIHPYDSATKLVAWCDAKWQFETDAMRWMVNHYGSTTVVEVTDAEVDLLSALLTKNYTGHIDREANSEVGTVNSAQAIDLSERLITELNKTANADFKALVEAYENIYHLLIPEHWFLTGCIYLVANFESHQISKRLGPASLLKFSDRYPIKYDKSLR